MSRWTTPRPIHRDAVSLVPRRSRYRHALRAAETELERLREQNRVLQESAAFFAELSERLNAQLGAERAQRQRERERADRHAAPCVGPAAAPVARS